MMNDGARALRTWMLALVGLGSAGSLLELMLLGHYEDAWQYLPLVAIVLAGAAMLWHLIRPGVPSLRAFQAIMLVFVTAGLLGVWFHFDGAMQFQREIDPSVEWSAMAVKALKSKAPPILAPGLMSQLGLLGLAYSFRHPVLSRGHGPAAREQEVTS